MKLAKYLLVVCESSGEKSGEMACICWNRNLMLQLWCQFSTIDKTLSNQIELNCYFKSISMSLHGARMGFNRFLTRFNMASADAIDGMDIY